MKINYNLYTKSVFLVIVLSFLVTTAQAQSCYTIDGAYMSYTSAYGYGTPVVSDDGHLWEPTSTVGDLSELNIWFYRSFSDPQVSASVGSAINVSAIDHADNTGSCGSPSICAEAGVCAGIFVDLEADTSTNIAIEASSYAAVNAVARAYDHDTDTYHYLQQNPDSNDFAQYAIQHRNDPNDLDQWQQQVDNQGSGPNQSVSTLLIDSWDDILSSEIDYLESGIIHYDTFEALLYITRVTKILF